MVRYDSRRWPRAFLGVSAPVWRRISGRKRTSGPVGGDGSRLSGAGASVSGRVRGGVRLPGCVRADVPERLRICMLICLCALAPERAGSRLPVRQLCSRSPAGVAWGCAGSAPEPFCLGGGARCVASPLICAVDQWTARVSGSPCAGGCSGAGPLRAWAAASRQQPWEPDVRPARSRPPGAIRAGGLRAFSRDEPDEQVASDKAFRLPFQSFPGVVQRYPVLYSGPVPVRGSPGWLAVRHMLCGQREIMGLEGAAGFNDVARRRPRLGRRGTRSRCAPAGCG